MHISKRTIADSLERIALCFTNTKAQSYCDFKVTDGRYFPSSSEVLCGGAAIEKTQIVRPIRKRKNSNFLSKVEKRLQTFFNILLFKRKSKLFVFHFLICRRH